MKQVTRCSLFQTTLKMKKDILAKIGPCAVIRRKLAAVQGGLGMLKLVSQEIVADCREDNAVAVARVARFVRSNFPKEDASLMQFAILRAAYYGLVAKSLKLFQVPQTNYQLVSVAYPLLRETATYPRREEVWLLREHTEEQVWALFAQYARSF